MLEPLDRERSVGLLHSLVSRSASDYSSSRNKYDEHEDVDARELGRFFVQSLPAYGYSSVGER